MLDDLKKYFTKKDVIEITREDYESAISAMRSMEKDSLVEPGWNSYQQHRRIVDEYSRQHPEEFR